MEYVFVKASEGYVFKKFESEVTSDEKIISEKEYMKKSDLVKRNLVMVEQEKMLVENRNLTIL